MSGPVDDGDRVFQRNTQAIEAAYRDLLGIEAVSRAVIAAFGEVGRGRDPQIGIGGDGPGSVTWYTMPTREPFQVPVRLDEQYPGDIAGQLDPIFRDASNLGSGVAAHLQGLVSTIYGVDNLAIARQADSQYHVLKSATVGLEQNFALVGNTLNNHWKGETTESWLEYYDAMSAVISALVDYGMVAQTGAAGTAAVIQAAKVSLAMIGTDAERHFNDVLGAWKADSENFPFQPGLSHVAVWQYVGLYQKAQEVAEKLPKPIAKVAETIKGGVDKATEVAGVVDLLIPHEDRDREPSEVVARAGDMLEQLRQSLIAKTQDVAQAHDALADGEDGTAAHLWRLSDDLLLVLPVDRPDGTYVP